MIINKVKKVTIIFVVLSLMILISSFGFAGEYDFGGDTITYTSIRILNEFHEPERAAHLEEVEEEFNVNIELGSYETRGDEFVEEFMAGIMSGDPGAEIWMVQTEWMLKLAREGGIYPLNEVLDDKYWENLDPGQPGPESHKFKGDYYGFNPWVVGPTGIMWNKTLFEEQGLPDLYEYVENGEWTWEVFKEVALEATVDTSGDGNIDQWGLPGLDKIRKNQYFATNEVKTVEKRDGNYKFALDKPESIETLEFLQELYNSGAMIPEEEAHPHISHMGSNRMIAMHPGSGRLLGIYADRGYEDEFGFVPLPKGPNADDYVNPYTGSWMHVIPVTTDYEPEALVALHKAMIEVFPTYDSQEIFDSRAAEGVQDEETHNYLMDLFGKGYFQKYLNETFIPGIDDMLETVIVEDQSPTAGVDGIKSAAQANLDEIFEQ